MAGNTNSCVPAHLKDLTRGACSGSPLACDAKSVAFDGDDLYLVLASLDLATQIAEHAMALAEKIVPNRW